VDTIHPRDPSSSGATPADPPPCAPATGKVWPWALGGGALLLVGGLLVRHHQAKNLSNEEWFKLVTSGVVPQPPNTPLPTFTGPRADPAIERDAASAAIGTQRWQALATNGWLFHVIRGFQ
jgi:hypothetical protein